MSLTPRIKLLLFAAACTACVALTVGYSLGSAGPAPALRDVALPPLATATVSAGAGLATEPPPVRVARVTPVRGERAPLPEAPAPIPAARPPLFLIRHTGLDQSYGALAADFGAASGEPRRTTTMQCVRVHFAGGRGVCLNAQRGAITTYSAVLFDASFTPTRTLPLAGIPSRTRVSPDGRHAAYTVFVSGHAYGAGGFSTETRIVESVTGEPIIDNLEQMQVWSNGARLESPDFNIWGVTFAADPDRFYATLGTAGVAYLVRGEISANRLTVVHAGVECPSLSPDNTRVAFKKRVPGPGLPRWRIYVLDLATLVETPLAESRHVDEQVEWLDNEQILYTQPDDGPSPAVTNVWVVPADGGGAPALLLAHAGGATVLRRPGH